MTKTEARKAGDRAEHWQLQAKIEGPSYLWLYSTRDRKSTYVVDGCTGRRA